VRRNNGLVDTKGGLSQENKTDEKEVKGGKGEQEVGRKWATRKGKKKKTLNNAKGEGAHIEGKVTRKEEIPPRRE